MSSLYSSYITRYKFSTTNVQSTISQINGQTVENSGRKFVPIDFRRKYKRLQLAEQQGEKVKPVI